MSQHVEGNHRTFRAGGALDQFIRVKLSSGVLVAAGLDEKHLGVMREDAYAANQIVAVHLRTANGTIKMIASKSISAGAEVFTAAAGKISDAQGVGAVSCGHALEAASGDNSIIEVLPLGGMGDTPGEE